MVKYIFMYNKNTSREYVRSRACVRDGAKKLPHNKWNTYRVNTQGNAGVERDLEGAKKRAGELLRSRPTGTVVVIEALKNAPGFQEVVDKVRFRKLETNPVKDTPGNLYLDRVEGHVEKYYRNARWAGDCVCKPRSDHAVCRAVDYFDSESNMVKIKNDMINDATYFGITYVILFNRIYYPGGGSSYYSGTYHSHVHISVGGESRSAC